MNYVTEVGNKCHLYINLLDAKLSNYFFYKVILANTVIDNIYNYNYISSAGKAEVSLNHIKHQILVSKTHRVILSQEQNAQQRSDVNLNSSVKGKKG